MGLLFSFLGSPLGKGTGIALAVLILFGVYQCKKKIEFNQKIKQNTIKLEKKKVEDKKVLSIYEKKEELENKSIPEVKELEPAPVEPEPKKESKEDKQKKDKLKKEVFEELELLR